MIIDIEVRSLHIICKCTMRWGDGDPCAIWICFCSYITVHSSVNMSVRIGVCLHTQLSDWPAAYHLPTTPTRLQPPTCQPHPVWPTVTARWATSVLSVRTSLEFRRPWSSPGGTSCSRPLFQPCIFCHILNPPEEEIIFYD